MFNTPALSRERQPARVEAFFLSTVPCLSVLMPVYNTKEQFLREAVESVLAQSFMNFEFLIVDDGSRQETQEILAGYAAQDPRIVLFRNEENLGLVHSLNKGLALARAPLVARMDSDDISLPARFATQVRFFEEHPEIVVVGSWIGHIDEDSKETGRVTEYPVEPKDVRQKIRNSPWSVMAHPSVMFRKGRILEVGGYRPLFCHVEDYDLWLRVADLGDVCANIPECLILYRSHGGSVTSTYFREQRGPALFAQYAASCRLRGLPDPADGIDTIPPDMAETVRLLLEGSPSFLPAVIAWVREFKGEAAPFLHPDVSYALFSEGLSSVARLKILPALQERQGDYVVPLRFIEDAVQREYAYVKLEKSYNRLGSLVVQFFRVLLKLFQAWFTHVARSNRGK